MRYRLIENSLNDVNNIQKTILLNRGINDYKTYLNLNDNYLHDYRLLKNIDEAVMTFIKHIECSNKIHILVDCDVDGYASASMMYRYIKSIDGNIPVSYSLHSGKQHGLSNEINIPIDAKLLIIPDAGTNDFEQCKVLKNKGMDIIILDHHLCDEGENPYAITVNNQICDYPNKNLCGAGIVYKFLQAIDDEMWNDYSDDYLDMVALANISDVMDMREFETRHLVNLGINKIRSKLFKALIEKQSYSMNDHINITTIQFYITPLLNAMIRVGDTDEKDLLFRAFIETDEVFKYKKRGTTDEVDEDIYTRAARLCTNAKSRQGKTVDKAVVEIHKLIDADQLYKNKVMFVNVTDVLASTLTGLAAIKLAEYYNRPCLLLRKQEDESNGILYGGSGRNFDDSPLDSFRDFLNDLNIFEFVNGHPSAFGFSIDRKNITRAIKTANEKLSDVDFTKYYNVDFELGYEELTIGFIKDICDLADMYGHGVKEPYVLIKYIPVNACDISIMGKTQNTWKVTDENGFAFIKFNCGDDDLIINTYKDLEETADVPVKYLNVIGKMSINNFKGILTPQIVVKDYEEVR